LEYQEAVLPGYKWPQKYPPGTGGQKFDVQGAMKLRTHGEEKSVLVSMEEASRLIKTITHEVSKPQRPPALLFFFFNLAAYMRKNMANCSTDYSCNYI